MGSMSAGGGKTAAADIVLIILHEMCVCVCVASVRPSACLTDCLPACLSVVCLCCVLACL